MSLPYRIDTDALSDIAAAADWYDQKMPGLGRRFIDEINRLDEEIVVLGVFHQRQSAQRSMERLEN